MSDGDEKLHRDPIDDALVRSLKIDQDGDAIWIRIEFRDGPIADTAYAMLTQAIEDGRVTIAGHRVGPWEMVDV